MADTIARKSLPGEQGPPGAQGPAGATGATGPAGPGLPAGGAVNQITVKSAAGDFVTQWRDSLHSPLVPVLWDSGDQPDLYHNTCLMIPYYTFQPIVELPDNAPPDCRIIVSDYMEQSGHTGVGTGIRISSDLGVIDRDRLATTLTSTLFQKTGAPPNVLFAVECRKLLQPDGSYKWELTNYHNGPDESFDDNRMVAYVRHWGHDARDEPQTIDGHQAYIGWIPSIGKRYAPFGRLQDAYDAFYALGITDMAFDLDMDTEIDSPLSSNFPWTNGNLTIAGNGERMTFRTRYAKAFVGNITVGSHSCNVQSDESFGDTSFEPEASPTFEITTVGNVFIGNISAQGTVGVSGTENSEEAGGNGGTGGAVSVTLRNVWPNGSKTISLIGGAGGVGGSGSITDAGETGLNGGNGGNGGAVVLSTVSCGNWAYTLTPGAGGAGGLGGVGNSTTGSNGSAGAAGSLSGGVQNSASQAIAEAGTSINHYVTPKNVSQYCNANTLTNVANTKKRVFGVVVDGAGSVPTTGVKGYWRCPYSGTITKATVLSNVSGSAVFDVWKTTYANYPPAVGNTITASAKPTLSASSKSEDSTLTGWGKTVTAGDCFGFNLDSVSTCTYLVLEIEMEITNG